MSKAPKHKGQVFTPDYLVKNILDLCGYTETSAIIDKHIIDNSCGDGAFLVEVAQRFIGAYRLAGYSDDAIKQALETYVHGIELDTDAYTKCIENLTTLSETFNLTGVKWNITNIDALTNTRYLASMDYVVGNPPYVRVHNISTDAKFLKTNYSFMREGMSDLYLAFFELGLYMLKDTGILGYVTPSSYFNSKAGGIFRDYIIRGRSLHTVVDFGHYQPFSATTYVAITLLTKAENDTVNYYEYDEFKHKPVNHRVLDFGDFVTDSRQLLFGGREVSQTQAILASEGLPKKCVVKNGITTLLDEFFISETLPCTQFVIPILKASTGAWERCIYPYNENGRPIHFDVLQSDLELSKRYETYKDRLLARDLQKGTEWYEFGRAQGIKDVYKQKYAVNSLIRSKEDIKLVACPSGTGVYGGLYILTDLSEDELRGVLVSDEFEAYVKSLGKYKSGGYYTYSSKELQLYLNYKLARVNLLY
jgi:adenine-specific DNA-methyltransferase